jgi:hypothetical protein
MSTVLVEVWADGPNLLGLWRGKWRLTLDGSTVPGRFGSTPWHDNAMAAIDEAASLGKSDKRNVPYVDVPSSRH